MTDAEIIEWLEEESAPELELGEGVSYPEDLGLVFTAAVGFRTSNLGRWPTPVACLNGHVRPMFEVLIEGGNDFDRCDCYICKPNPGDFHVSRAACRCLDLSRTYQCSAHPELSAAKMFPGNSTLHP